LAARINGVDADGTGLPGPGNGFILGESSEVFNTGVNGTPVPGIVPIKVQEPGAVSVNPDLIDIISRGVSPDTGDRDINGNSPKRSNTSIQSREVSAAIKGSVSIIQIPPTRPRYVTIDSDLRYAVTGPVPYYGNILGEAAKGTKTPVCIVGAWGVRQFRTAIPLAITV
jgi:hypothetical protein